jgi:hypothetical protein
VNDTTEKTAPAGTIDQIGKCLSCIIHAFAEADDAAKIFMAKWDIKDGFWRMDCAAGEEWNFAYVLPQEEGEPITLVVPTSLQMGWVESPPYFCSATETSRDISTEYIETEVNSLHRHKFEHYVVGASAYTDLPESGHDLQKFSYMVEVYVDDFMSLVISTSLRGVLQRPLFLKKTAETRLPAGNKYSCTSPSFYLSFCSPSFLVLKYSPIIAAQILPYQAALLEHVTCLSYIFATHHRNVDSCVLHSPGQK